MQSGHAELPNAPIPAAKNNAVHHWTFQKFHIARSLSKNNTPSAAKVPPHIFMHLSHMQHIGHHLFHYLCNKSLNNLRIFRVKKKESLNHLLNIKPFRQRKITNFLAIRDLIIVFIPCFLRLLYNGCPFLIVLQFHAHFLLHLIFSNLESYKYQLRRCL